MFFKLLHLVAALASVVSVRGAPTNSTRSTPTVSTPGPVPTVTNAPAIAAGIKGEPSVIDGLNKLLKDSSGNLLTGEALRQLTVFDFNNQAPAAGAQGGSILLATVDNFPILEDFHVAAAVSIFEPCGLNIPHSHPRASEFLTVVEGILNTGFVQENGFNTEIETQLGKFQCRRSEWLDAVLDSLDPAVSLRKGSIVVVADKLRGDQS